MDYWILDGHTPVRVASVMEWAPWSEDVERRRVALNQWGDGAIRVSTVFLGIDHNFGGVGPPILFETMIFWNGDPELDEYTDRSATWVDAEANHMVAVTLVELKLAASRS